MKKTLTVLLVFLVSILIVVSINSNWTNPDDLIYQKESNFSVVDTPEEDSITYIEEKISKANILAVGDIMFHTPQIKAAYISEDQIYNFSNVFKYVKEHISSADLAIANFETVTYGDEIGFSGFPRFNSPIETLSAIKEAGFDILNTVNNHALDQGKQGLINTIDFINQYEMKNIGTYKEPNIPILVEEINDIKLAFLSYSYGFNGLEGFLTEEEKSYMISRIDEEKIKNDIEGAKSLEVDIIVVYIHWGNEYEREPSEYQTQLGKKMLEWGANIILGSHPHVIQKAEIIDNDINDNFIIYSMGNFLSNQREESMGNRYTEDGIMVEIELEKNFQEDKTIIKNINYIPTWTRRYVNNGNLEYEIIPIKNFFDNKELYNKLNEDEKLRISESFDDTMKLMTQ